MSNIPKIIRERAASDGFKGIEAFSVNEYGETAYSVFNVDEHGDPIPTGLPIVYLLRGDRIQVKTGEEALNLF